MASKEIKFLLKHSTIYGFGTVLSQLIGFIMLPIYTRYLTPKDYGVLQLIETSTFLLGMVLTTGIAQTLSRFYYDHNEEAERKKTVSTMYITYCCVSLIVLPFLLLSAPILSTRVLDSLVYKHYFYVSFVSFVLGGLLDIGLVYLRVQHKSGYFTIISVSRLLILVSLNVYFIVFKGLGVLGILYSVLITRSLYQMVLTVPILMRIRFRFSFRYSIDMLKFSLPLIPARLANTFINQSDRYFIRYFISISDTGIYSLAQKLGTAIHLLVTVPLQSAFEPRRFEIVKNADAKQRFNQIFVYHAFVLVFVGLVISTFVPEILQLMVTPRFYMAGDFVPLIIFSMIIFGFRNHFEFGILWSKKTRYYAYINGIMAVTNLGLNCILIWYLGLWGAVYSATVVTIIHTALIYLFGKKDYPIRFDFSRVGKLFAVACTIYGISLLVNTNYIIIDFLMKGLLMLLFLAGCFWVKAITREDASILLEVYQAKIRPIAASLNPMNSLKSSK